MTFRTRFAPSPTGPLHLGHAFSALVAYDWAQAQGGEFLLRIEDIDQSRARPEWESQIYEDLTWLGVTWPRPVMRQSERMADYGAALDRLWEQGLLYPCHCSRSDIAAATSAPQEGAPQLGPDGVVYPGTCRDLSPRIGPRPRNVTLRFDIAKALHGDLSRLGFEEHGMNAGKVSLDVSRLPKTVGDFVIARRDMGTSYHLAVVLDDDAQAITHVVRGVDLFDATQIHVLLQQVLDLPTPHYLHHPLVRDEQGKRLAKRDDARAISLYRSEGLARRDILAKLDVYRAMLTQDFKLNGL
ncbi:Glutamyl-Q-tRNA synthetase [Sulfitobacter noctilucae]|uniref:tRNA glutamyl-Q(34) synthetase GluQRS n=1 Tax=Sulfitobacter noctilucae TaxID=1342302 RepID=UPI00046AEED4|nr:tRNA glutamyl-Q(34) synthetase GluQRS [Sulfitobacter noctilucae]KIN60932.1 Glutamyl-Q-tRNA synthetase [Sulfitobacter noctilucae]